MKSIVTITIVYYKDLPKEYFDLSLSSALSQVAVNYKINLYLEDVVFNLKLPRVNIIQLPKNIYSNPVKIREYIIKSVDTEFIAFWDSDDVYTIDRLYFQINKLVKNNLNICCSNFSFFDDNSLYNKDFFNMIGFGVRNINIFDENYIGLGIITARTSYLKSLLPFPVVFTLDWWIAIISTIKGIKIGCLKKIHGYYRIHNNSLSRNMKNPKKDDFINERRNKLSLYNTLIEEYPYFNDRLEYYNSLDINEKYHSLKNEYLKRKYKNIWGGLIKYVEK